MRVTRKITNEDKKYGHKKAQPKLSLNKNKTALLI